MRAGAHFLPRTARNPKVRLETMALMKPVQLKDSSAAEAMATPTYRSRCDVTEPCHDQASSAARGDPCCAGDCREFGRDRLHLSGTLL